MKAKISFRLVRDEDGYPPFDVEGLWAETQDGILYTIDNIPFFTSEVTVGDVVLVKRSSETLIFDSVVSRSKHSLVRVIVYSGDTEGAATPSAIASIRHRLDLMGCGSEAFGELAIIAVDIPPNVDLSKITAYLADLEREELITYEEAIVRHPTVET